MHGNALCAHDHYARGLGSQDSEVRTALQLKLAGHHVADQVGQAISIYVLRGTGFYWRARESDRCRIDVSRIKMTVHQILQSVRRAEDRNRCRAC